MRHVKQKSQSKPALLRSGVAMVELAVVFPFLLTLIFGMMEFSRYVMVKQAVTNAAREGAREAALVTTTSTASCDAAVRNHLSSAISNSANVSQVGVSVGPSLSSSTATGTTITVVVKVNYSDVSLFPASFLGSTVITAQATTKRE